LRSFGSLADLVAHIDVPIGPTAWEEVRQERVDCFADATGDHQWIHVDPERATAGPFGGTIAHGYLTLSLIPWLATRLYGFDFAESRINYGTDKVRFPTPVRVGKRIRLHSTIGSVAPQGPGHLVSVQHVLEVEDEPKPACVALALTLLLPRGVAD
jgi:acyl dehydratase